ncbi:MAG: AraC family transcriptional regulator [Ruminococcaceae bacterium]|nr:AraC family transcriptional regulator [Oscillospiraceae bacterium]
MYISCGYLNIPEIPFADHTVPLLVCSCGNYRLSGDDRSCTQRPMGRPDYQLLYVVSGRAEFVIGGKAHQLTAGHMVLFRPHQPQHYRYHGRDHTQTYWVHFTGGQVEEILASSGFSPRDSICFAGPDPALGQVFDSMICELQTRRANFQTMLELYLRQLFLLSRRTPPPTAALTPALHRQMEDARRYFAQHYNTPISIRDYAASQNVSISWFLRCFKQVTGQTPMQYILSLRITNAITLMRDTDWNLTQIATAVGYDNPLYFSRLFRKQKGMAPSTYRRLLAENRAE